MKPKVNYLEYTNLAELLKRVENFVYRVEYDGEYIYFVPMSSYGGEIYLHFYITDTKFEGYVTINSNSDQLIFSKTAYPNYVPIIELKKTSFIGEWILEYKKKVSQSV